MLFSRGGRLLPSVAADVIAVLMPSLPSEGAIDIDVAEWRSMTTVENARGGGRSMSGNAAQTEAWFWEAVRDVAPLDRRKLLYFWTSSSPPAGGIAHLDRRLALQFDASVSQPQAATCFYSLTMPLVDTPAAMHDLLQVCIAHWQSWGTA